MKTNSNRVFLFVLTLYLYVSVIDALNIIFISKLFGFVDGGNRFKITSDDIDPDNLPTLYVSNYEDTSVQFNFIRNNGMDFFWSVPPPPQLRTAGKRKQVDQLEYQFTIYQGFDVVYNGLFYYVEPTISKISPNSYYPKANGKFLIIYGEYFMLNEDDLLPVVEFYRNGENPIRLTVESAKSSQIKCIIPNRDPNHLDGFGIRLVFYTGLQITSYIGFTYVLPSVTNIYPDRGIAGVQHRITIEGYFLIDNPGLPLSQIKIGNTLCTNVEYNEEYATLSCDTPVINIQPGTTQETRPVTVIIDKQHVYCDRYFTFFTAPTINSIQPKNGMFSGGTILFIEGQYLEAVSEVLIGGVQCNIDQQSITSNGLRCETGAINLNGQSQVTSNVQVKIGNNYYSSPDTEKFTYFGPSITSVEPLQLIDKGSWRLTIKGIAFGSIQNSIAKLGVIKTFNPIAQLSTDSTIYVDIDTSQVGLGTFPLSIISNDQIGGGGGGFSTNSINIQIQSPTIALLENQELSGYIHYQTLLSFAINNCPNYLWNDIGLFLGGKPCISKFVAENNIICLFQAGDVLGQNDFTFNVIDNSIQYQPNIHYEFFEPTITDQQQQNVFPQGGGQLTINGNHLNIINVVKVRGRQLVGACTFTPNQIICTLPRNLPGNYPVELVSSTGHSYNTGTNVEYTGPTITKVEPRQGTCKKAHRITIHGSGFGVDPNDIDAAFGLNGAIQCNNIMIETADTKFSCDLPIIPPDSYTVRVSIQPINQMIPMISINDFSYRSNRLSCLGPPLDDNSNSPVDWWFIYKVKDKLENSYAYIDSTMERLERRINLVNHNTLQLSPLEATYMQYSDYYYVFFNDQSGYRKPNGNREKTLGNTHNHGHVKGFVLWDDIDNNGVIKGINVPHSQPIFPTYVDGTNSAYYDPSDIRFQGIPDKSQHFFCYSTDDIDQVFEYYLKTDAPHLIVSRLTPNLDQWDQQQMNDFPHFYDFMYSRFPNDINNVQRQPVPFPPPLNLIPYASSGTYRAACANASPNTLDLQNICWWDSGNVEIANRALRARYFMKTSNQGVHFPHYTNPRPINMSPYINANQLNGKRKFDGVDIWMVVADVFQKKMFIRTYLGGIPEMEPKEQILDVAYLEFPTYLVQQYFDNTGVLTQFGPFQFGTGNDHSKIGFSMYPTIGDNAFNANENYFCVGDNNRHNNQGSRGGGAICFQHPTLVWQFNRMVRQYVSLDGVGVMTSPLKQYKASLELFLTIELPVRLNRPQTWAHEFYIETKDSINGQHIQKLPRDIHTINGPPLVVPNQPDITISMQSLRTHRDNVGPFGESSVVPLNPTIPGQDIINYIGDDLCSINYIAFDSEIGAICDFDDEILDCTRWNSRSTLIPRVVSINYQPKVFPPSYGFMYSNIMKRRTFNLEGNLDFNLIHFTSEFMALLPNPHNTFYQYMFDINNDFNRPQIYLPVNNPFPFIIRKTTDICEEEIAYLMTLHYLYYQADKKDKLLFKLNNEQNWVNGMVIAISKKLYNSIRIGKDSRFGNCFSSILLNYDNIENYADDGNMDQVSQETLLKRTISATWDWMSDSYKDNGVRVQRIDNTAILTPQYLMELIARVEFDDMIQNLNDLSDYVDVQYRTPVNFDTILISHNIKSPPPPNVKIPNVQDVVMVNFILPHKSLQSTTDNILQSTSLQQKVQIKGDERNFKPAIHQLLESLEYINQTNLISLDLHHLEKLELAMNKWIVINGWNQAIKSLVIDPATQYSHQILAYLDTINRDQNGNPIDLGYQKVTGIAGTRITLSSPHSIISITFILESILIGQSTEKVKFGDFEVYFYRLPEIMNDDQQPLGLAMVKMNSQLCDIKTMTEEDFINRRFNQICSGIGPVITGVSRTSGSSQGGYGITIDGIRFNMSMSVYIGYQFCMNTQLISSERLVCNVPSGTGKNHPITLTTNQSLFNIQRTKFLFSFDAPTIATILPAAIDRSNREITIIGNNFGNYVQAIKVVIGQDYLCSPILNITNNGELIICLAPTDQISGNQALSVSVDGQKSNSASIKFSGPIIDFMAPPFGDAQDSITILGTGFGGSDENFSEWLPLVLIDDNPVEIINSSNQEIIINLDYDTEIQSLEIKHGEQTLSSNFNYYPPILSMFDESVFVNTSGGLIQFSGFGLGVSSEDINFKIYQYSLEEAVDLDCNAFDRFIECYVGPGTGRGYLLAGSIADQLIVLDTVYVSYRPPEITGYKIIGDMMEIYGYNFIPNDLYDTQPMPDNSIVMVSYDGYFHTCGTFISSTKVVCNLNTSDKPISIRTFIGGQTSNTFFLDS